MSTMRRGSFLAGACATAALPAARAMASTLPAASLSLGNEVFIESAWRALRGKRAGIITNQTGVTSRLVSVVDAIRAHTQLDVRAVFAPEHGFRGDRSAGAYVASYTDAATGLPVYSLYGPTRHASAQMLANVDVLLFDIQDVGDRAYTYISTMAYAMQDAKTRGLPIYVLDRPNPVGGALVEGPVLQPEFASFIGLYPIAMRHGMTIGELARMFNDRFGIGADLHVVPMRGWQREMIWPDTGLQWVQSSPNIPTWETTFVYVCTGLIDNAGVNNGTNYTKPFFYAGAQGVDPQALASHLNAANLPGVFFRGAAWTPTSGFWAGKELSGVELVLFDPRTFRGTQTAVHIIAAVRAIAPRAIVFKEPQAFDRDWGTDEVRRGITGGASPASIVNGWEERLSAFRASRAKYLLY